MRTNPIRAELESLRQFLVRQIDGSPETRGRDQAVTAHIKAVDRAMAFIELDDLSETMWFDAANPPDDEVTVLIALDDGEVWTGYHEGEGWLYVSGDPMASKVTHWKHLPEPPGAAPRVEELLKVAA